MTASTFCSPESFLCTLRMCLMSSLMKGCSPSPSPLASRLDSSLPFRSGTAGTVAEPLAAASALAFFFFALFDSEGGFCTAVVAIVGPLLLRML